MHMRPGVFGDVTTSPNCGRVAQWFAAGESTEEEHMEFSVGEHIVHPAHGTGTVVGVKNQELATGYQSYYVIRFADKRLTVQVPSRKADEIGLRSVMGSTKCEEVMRVLQVCHRRCPTISKSGAVWSEPAAFRRPVRVGKRCGI